MLEKGLNEAALLPAVDMSDLDANTEPTSSDMANTDEVQVTESETLPEPELPEPEPSFQSLSATRRGKLGHCTRRMNELKKMMNENADVTVVKSELNAFKLIIGDFTVCHESAQALLSDEMKESENLDWYEPKMETFRTFITDTEAWVAQHEVAPQLTHEVAPQLTQHVHLQLPQHDVDSQALVDPTDNASKGSSSSSCSRSSRSSKSSKSYLSATRAELAADRAALLARANTLKEKHNLQREKFDLQARMEALQLKEDFAVKDAKLKVLNAFEHGEEIKPTFEQENDMNTYLDEYLETQQPQPIETMATEDSRVDSVLSPPHFAELGTVPKTPLQTAMRAHQMPAAPTPTTTTKTTTTATIPMTTANPLATHATSRSTASKRVSQQMGGQSTPAGGASSPMNISAQSDMTNLLVSVVSQTSLPKKEVPVFSGDPLEYQLFTQAFRHNIEDKTDSYEDRLYFLEQFTAGQPKQLVRSCLHMDAAAGYKEAKRLLKHHFGDEFKITVAYMQKALDWATIRPDDVEELNSYALYLRSCNNSAKTFQYMSELDLPSNMKLIVTKLPYKLRERWRSAVCNHMEQTQQRPKFHDLVKFIEREVRIMQDPVFGNIQDVTKNQKPRQAATDTRHTKSGSKKTFATTVSPVTTSTDANTQNSGTNTNMKDAFAKPCMYCQGHHTMESCRRIAKIPHDQKVEFLKSNGLCFGCLTKGHLSKTCKNRLTCHSCAKKHPTILHFSNSPPDGAMQNTTVSSVTKTDGSNGSVLVSMTTSTGQTGAGTIDHKLPIVPVKVKASKGSHIIQTYAFLDSGSSATFCTEALMEQLSVRGRKTEILLRTMNQEKPVQTYSVTGLEVCSLDGDDFIALPEVFTQCTIPVKRENIPCEDDVKQWPYLHDIHLKSITADVSLLIGVNVPKALEPLRVISSQDEGPYAVLVRLGWIVNGPLGIRSPVDQHGRPLVTSNRISVARLEELLVQQYNQEFSELACEEKSEHSFEDKRFLKIMNESVTKRDGHYELRLPFRRDDVCLPNNKKMAEQRALSLKRKLERNAMFKKDYVSFMNDVLKKGHAEMVPEAQLHRNDGRLWYIPHHGVYHKQKGSIRVVFDCTSSFQGTSLNSELLQGPDLTNTLLGVLLRFRQESVAMMGDIEGMFHQVKIPEDDVDFLRFLWWPDGDTEKPLTEYRMIVHLFGAVSSPSCANFALRQTAEDNKDKAIIKKTLYSVTKEQTMDDECLHTALCEVEAILNARPITSTSGDPKDPEPLTPNHLLLLKGKPILPPGLFNRQDCYSRRRWKQVQYLSDLFWKRWTREYLSLMQERQRWNDVKRNLKPGDLVLIIDETAPRNSWPMGLITETFPDTNGHVRRVKVKTQTGTLERPITKLCLLKDMA